MSNLACPTCNNPWNGKLLIGLSENTTAPSSISRRRVRRDPQAVADEGEGDEDE